MPLDHSYSEIDSGPIYKETLYGRWPVEPYNTATTLFFLALVLYWWLKIKPHYKEHALLTVTLPVIGVGFVGGFLYHSLRNHSFWLYLDWGPIFISANIVAVYFWRTHLTSWRLSLLYTYTPLFAVLATQKLWAQGTSLPTLSYFFLVLSVIAPLINYIYRHPRQYLKYIGLAFASITLALTSRLLDRNHLMDWLPMGSHFLWHTFGALTCHFFIGYIYLERPRLLGTTPSQAQS